ncbi:hypothetical protein [Microbacterium halotolerans]|nr:hypothetical protein [Microbacterium halotolerans]
MRSDSARKSEVTGWGAGLFVQVASVVFAAVVVTVLRPWRAPGVPRL